MKANRFLHKTILIIAASCMLCSCSDLFQSKIAMNVKNSSMTLVDLFHEEEKITKLGVSEQLFASQGMSKDTIQVSWLAVPGATSYRLERAVVENGAPYPAEEDFILLSSFVSTTEYTDVILRNAGVSNAEYDMRYYYRVSAENRFAGYEPGDFSDYEAQSACGWLFPPVSSVTAEKGMSTDHITLSWQAVPDAVEYQIYRGMSDSNAGMSLITSVRGNRTVWTDSIQKSQQGIEYYYQIYAVGSSGQLSAASGRAMGYCLREGAPAAAVVTVVGEPGTSTTQLSVSWNAISVPEGYSINYSVYRTSSEDSVFTLLAKNYTATAYTDSSSSLKKNVIYYYYVQAVQINESDAEDVLRGPFSASGPDSADPARAFLLSPPGSVQIADVPGSQSSARKLVRWQPAVGDGFDGVSFSYKIFASESQEPGSFQVISGAEGIVPHKGADGWYEYETDRYGYYKVITVNENASALESEFSIMAAPVPDAPVSVTASQTQAVSGAANSSGVYPVIVTWKAPADNPAGYVVYRSTKAESGFRKLNEDPVTQCGTNGSFSFVDANDTAKPGVIYYYKVISLNSLGQGNKANVPVWGYGSLTADQWFREYNKTVLSSQKKLTLMHKPVDTDKLGSETVRGAISGTLAYTAKLAGLGAEITMHYDNYADFYMNGDSAFGVYFRLTGNTDTTSNMSANGTMHEVVNCQGMYPGVADYNHLEIKGGGAGGGWYGVTTYDLDGNTILKDSHVDWKVGEER